MVLRFNGRFATPPPPSPPKRSLGSPMSRWQTGKVSGAQTISYKANRMCGYNRTTESMNFKGGTTIRPFPSYNDFEH